MNIHLANSGLHESLITYWLCIYVAKFFVKDI